MDKDRSYGFCIRFRGHKRYGRTFETAYIAGEGVKTAMLMRPHLCKALILLFLLMTVGAHSVWAQKRALVQTEWDRSDGMRSGEDVYFLSSYSLYLPGRVIIPLFFETDARYLYRDLSLYRLSGGAGDELKRLWSFGRDMSEKVVDLQSCRYARSGNKLYFSWRGEWDKQENESIHPVLEYDLDSSHARLFEDAGQLGDLSQQLEYHHADKVAESEVWGRAGLLPLSEWDLPSPLEYSSRDPKFLKKVILEQKADRHFRSAAFTELEEQREEKVLREILAEFAKGDNDIQRETYTTKWEVLIRMSATLRGDSPPDVFSAAFDNNTEALQDFLEAGVDPDRADEAGRTLLMYAVLGEAPDTMRLLFEAGADPEKETDSGKYPWLYAALNPLRPRFLELWGK